MSTEASNNAKHNEEESLQCKTISIHLKPQFEELRKRILQHAKLLNKAFFFGPTQEQLLGAACRMLQDSAAEIANLTQIHSVVQSLLRTKKKKKNATQSRARATPSSPSSVSSSSNSSGAVVLRSEHPPRDPLVSSLNHVFSKLFLESDSPQMCVSPKYPDFHLLDVNRAFASHPVFGNSSRDDFVGNEPIRVGWIHDPLLFPDLLKIFSAVSEGNVVQADFVISCVGSSRITFVGRSITYASFDKDANGKDKVVCVNSVVTHVERCVLPITASSLPPLLPPSQLNIGGIVRSIANRDILSVGKRCVEPPPRCAQITSRPTSVSSRTLHSTTDTVSSSPSVSRGHWPVDFSAGERSVSGVDHNDMPAPVPSVVFGAPVEAMPSSHSSFSHSSPAFLSPTPHWSSNADAAVCSSTHDFPAKSTRTCDPPLPVSPPGLECGVGSVDSSDSVGLEGVLPRSSLDSLPSSNSDMDLSDMFQVFDSSLPVESPPVEAGGVQLSFPSDSSTPDLQGLPEGRRGSGTFAYSVAACGGAALAHPHNLDSPSDFPDAWPDSSPTD